MSEQARNHKRPPVRRQIRTAKLGSAREAIGTLTPGCEIFILTYGQFSLIDALVAVVEQTGPADVTLSTWTAANTDLTTAARLVEASQFRSLRMIVDQSFISRQPAYCAHMRRLFGDDCIRTTRSHAKFATICNDQWQIAIRTSMNLNTNPRLENLEISDDPGLCEFLNRVADDIFAEQEPGIFDQTRLPELASIPNVERAGTVAVGKLRAGGTVSTGRVTSAGTVRVRSQT